tara:strand:+ start:320 stop:493 length:174 start_codon:yes stop_codon:yes gene_type:complete
MRLHTAARGQIGRSTPLQDAFKGKIGRLVDRCAKTCHGFASEENTLFFSFISKTCAS